MLSCLGHNKQSPPEQPARPKEWLSTFPQLCCGTSPSRHQEAAVSLWKCRVMEEVHPDPRLSAGAPLHTAGLMRL